MNDPQENQVQLIFNGDEYFSKIRNLIDSAKEEILIESYIFHFDPIGIAILNCLTQAIKRGVQVRLLVDGVGSYNSVNKIHQECQNKKIPFRIYHPLPFELKLIPKLSWKNLKRFLRTFQRINKRNHRKVVIVDRQDVMMGSFNISQVHSEHFLSEKSWRDTGAHIQMIKNHPEIENLALAFLQAWRRSKYFSSSNFKSFLFNRKLRPHKQSHLFRLNNHTYWRFLLLYDLKSRIRNAQKQIFLTNAYFLPRRSVLTGLRKAARRGIDVRILLPVKSDVWIVRQASLSLYYRLLKSGVRIFEYQPRMMHAKTLLIDHWATIGSHNLNHRSFIHDLEAEVVVEDSKNIDKLFTQWQNDLLVSKEVTLQDLGKLSWIEKTTSRFIYWFRYWL